MSKSPRIQMRACAIVLCCVTPPYVHAQQLDSTLIGSRVRLDTSAGSLIAGTLIGMDADSIRVIHTASGTAHAVARRNVVSAEVSVGRERRAGAKRGALIGGAAGLALVAVSLRTDTATVNRRSGRLDLTVPAAIGLTLAGAAIGAAAAPER